MVQESIHELFKREEKIGPGSERAFGVVMAAALVLLSLLNWWHEGQVWPWMGGIAVLLFFMAYLSPATLKPINWLWFRFGLMLHGVVNPIVMGLLYYSAVLPTGLIMRAMGKDILRLKRDPDIMSYWILRRPPGPSPETMKDQF